MQKITPFLWFDNNAEEAMNFYISVFKNGKILNVNRLPEGAPAAPANILTATFELHGQQLMVLNGGPHFKFTEAISLFVNCETQAEVDDLWSKLSAGGKTSQCGWLQDKFGLWWQVAPSALGKLMGDRDPAKAKRVMDAMLKMTKIDIAALQRAYEGA
jgi:predicted 3-demethylubiquinone-9 3-methyltransferase (glyoxalase superfamily)